MILHRRTSFSRGYTAVHVKAECLRDRICDQVSFCDHLSRVCKLNRGSLVQHYKSEQEQVTDATLASLESKS
jgi:hypothetical protein